MESRRTVLKYLATAASASSLASLESFAQGLTPGAHRPNIVCFVGEGLRADELSSTGNKLIHTPNMDRIGREGCTFSNGFVVNALCLPSRATMLTGMYSHTTGAVSNVQGKIPRASRSFPISSSRPAMKPPSSASPTSKARSWSTTGTTTSASLARPTTTAPHHRGRARPVRPAKLTRPVRRHAPHRKGRRLPPAEARQALLPLPLVYAPHAPFYRPKDLVNNLNGVPIPKPATFDENLKDYPGKPRAVADADNKVGYSEVFSDDP